MAAYAAVISLKHTIKFSLLNSFRIPFVSSTREMLESAYDQTTSLQQVVELFNQDSHNSSSKRLEALEGQIRDCAHKLEDFLLLHELKDKYEGEEVRQEISSFIKTVMKMKKDYVEELSKYQKVQGKGGNPNSLNFWWGKIMMVCTFIHHLYIIISVHYEKLRRENISDSTTNVVCDSVKVTEEEEDGEGDGGDDDDDDDDDDDVDDDGDDDASIDVWSNLDSDHVEIVNSTSYIFSCFIRDEVLKPMRPDDLYFFSFLGKVGCGKTMAALKHLEDIGKELDCCAWVTVGATHQHQLKEAFTSILSQVLDTSESPISEDEDEELCYYLHKMLKNRKYMIVLDDVRDVEVVECLRRALPDQSNGSIVLFTTASEEVAQLADKTLTIEWSDANFQEIMRFSLSSSMFHSASMPPEFEEAGKQIIDNCEGSFVALAKVSLFLLDTEKTVEQWSKIAADRENPIFMVEDELSEVSKIKREMQTYSTNDLNKDEDFRREKIASFINFASFFDIKTYLYPERFLPKMKIISLWGMAGIGKTTLVRRALRDEPICCPFDHRVWVTLGLNYQTEEILIDILTQIHPSIDKSLMKGDEKLVRELCVPLSSKRCLIVLDDLWSKEPIYQLKTLFPEIKGVMLVTTRLGKVAKFGMHEVDLEMDLLDDEQSWLLLCRMVFGGESCPFELEKAGRKIAKMCDGLPLLIVTVADQLLKLEKSQENWNGVASGKERSVFMNAHNRISKALLPSYQILPHHLKACFLYMGVFCEQVKISTSKLTNLWIAEGFLGTNDTQMIEEFIAESLSELVDNSLIMAICEVSDSQIKTCRLHSVFWHLSNSQAVKTRFFHAMNSYDDCLFESIKSHRRLCIRNSILLGMKDVQASMPFITGVHSLLCVGPFQQYPVPLNFDWRLLRMMDALTIRLYDFPVEVVSLVHLRYLGLTCNGKIPTSVSNLWKLQYLIVKRYMNIKSSTNSWPLPVEIWDMKELKHLQVMGGRLPDHECGDGLLKLSTLLDVCAESCRDEVLEWMPNLKKLGIRIEVSPNDEGNSFHYLNNISRVHGLESLKCTVVNPQMTAVHRPVPVSMFPSSLKKLSLSGLGYAWQYMSIIGKLENLESLKLKSYAFQGAEWTIDFDNEFKKLMFLLVEDSNLVQWRVVSPNGTRLKRLIMKHCYRLKELPLVSHFYPLEKIEIVDCNPLAVAWAEVTEESLNFEVNVKLSWMHPENDST